MAVERYTHPKVQWMDSNGDPLAGGKLYFYESGTSTPLDTYDDDDLVTANANPVVADANGVWSDIWLKDQAYKVVLKDQNDVQIWSADPVNSAAAADSDTTARVSQITFIINGNGSAITTGVKGYVPVEFACTITKVTLVTDQSGSIVVDIWKDTYANFPPTDADSITASAVPTISSSNKYNDTTLTGWTKTLSAGDVLGFNVDSITTCTFATIVLKVTKT